MKSKLFFCIVSIFCLFSQIKAKDAPLNINTLIDKATNQNKQTLIFFHMNHCGYCKRMEKRVFKNPEIQKNLKKKFLFTDINIDDNDKVIFNTQTYSKRDFAHSLDIDFFPTVLFLDENYDITYTVRGYRDRKKFKKILQFIQTKSYETIDFFDYKKEE